MSTHFGVTWSILGSLEHNTKISPAIDLKLGTDICLESGKIYSFWGSLGSILGSVEHNSKTTGTINLKLGTDTRLEPGKMSVHFGVTVVNFEITGVV